MAVAAKVAESVGSIIWTPRSKEPTGARKNNGSYSSLETNRMKSGVSSPKN